MSNYSNKTKQIQRRQRGFTLLELMIVISIIFILIGMAVGQYRKTVQRAREAALHTDLQTMRQAIDNYTLDKLSPPQSLDQLKSEGYLREVPVDPITQSRDWVIDYGDSTVLSPDQTGSGITDVKSASPLISMEGTAYSSW